MKKMFQAAVMAAAVLAVPAMSLAAQAKPAAPAQTKPAATSPAPMSAKPATKTATTKTAAVHSTKGVVKSMDASSLVISSKTGKKKASHDMRFVLDPATQKDASLAVGANVTVKYHNDAKQHVATEVRAAAATAKKS